MGSTIEGTRRKEDDKGEDKQGEPLGVRFDQPSHGQSDRALASPLLGVALAADSPAGLPEDLLFEVT